SMQFFGQQVVALMDHLGLEQSVVLGTSLGANTALEIACAHPERLRGMVIEMPVLDNALLWSALAFTPLLVALTFGEPAMRFLSRGARAVPRGALPHYGHVAPDVLRQCPASEGPGRGRCVWGRGARRRAPRPGCGSEAGASERLAP